MDVPLLSYMGVSPFVLFVFDNKIIKSSAYTFVPTAMRGRQAQISLQRLCVRYEKILELPPELQQAITEDFVDIGDYGDPIFTDDDGIIVHFLMDFVLKFQSDESVTFDHFVYVEEELDYYRSINHYQLRKKSAKQITVTPSEAFFILSGFVFSDTNYYIQIAMMEVGKYQYTRTAFLTAENTIQQIEENNIRSQSPDKSENRWIDRRINLGLLFFDYLLDLLLNNKIQPSDLLRLNCGNYLLPMLEHKPVKNFFINILTQIENYDKLDLLTRSLYYYFIYFVYTELSHLSRKSTTNKYLLLQISPLLEMLEKRSRILEDVELSITDS